MRETGLTSGFASGTDERLADFKIFSSGPAIVSLRRRQNESPFSRIDLFVRESESMGNEVCEEGFDDMSEVK